jgi:hypothetical protein
MSTINRLPTDYNRIMWFFESAELLRFASDEAEIPAKPSIYGSSRQGVR